MAFNVENLSLLPFNINDGLEKFSLVWLDPAVNTEDIEFIRSNVRNLQTYVTIEECVQHIQESTNDCITFFVNDSLGQIVVPHIHQLKQIKAIYVYNSEGSSCQPWTFKYTKIRPEIISLKDFMTEIMLEMVRRTHVDEALPISIVDISSTGINGNFLHLRLLIDILVGMNPSPLERKELLEFCRNVYKDDPVELKRLEEFEREYHAGIALRWYTRESFVYRMLNKAFRTTNIDVLIHFRSIIRDIKYQLKREQLSSSICAYRAQLMSLQEIAILQESVGKLISINSFVSSTIDRSYAIFLLNSGTSDSLQRVLFEIDADPSGRNMQPFANISSHSFFPGEAEILFMAGSIFQLVSFRQDNGIYIAYLTLCSDEDNSSSQLLNHFRQEIGEKNNLFTLGALLFKSGKFEVAKKCLVQHMKELSENDKDMAHCFHLLGNILSECGDSDEALRMYKKALEMNEQLLPSIDPVIGNNHNNIGLIYMKKGDLKQALSSFEKAFDIYQRVYGEIHERLTIVLDNIGTLYSKEQRYNEALIYYKKSLFIKEKVFPSNHPRLAASYGNIGDVFNDTGVLNLAMEQYKIQLEINLKSLPHDHLDIASCYSNMGAVLIKQGNYSQGMQMLEKANTINMNSLPLNHPDMLLVKEQLKYIQAFKSTTN